MTCKNHWGYSWTRLQRSETSLESSVFQVPQYSERTGHPLLYWAQSLLSSTSPYKGSGTALVGTWYSGLPMTTLTEKRNYGDFDVFLLPVACFKKQLHFLKKRDWNVFIHREAVTFIEKTRSSYLPFGRLFVSDALEQKGIIGQTKDIPYSIT